MPSSVKGRKGIRLLAWHSGFCGLPAKEAPFFEPACWNAFWRSPRLRPLPFSGFGQKARQARLSGHERRLGPLLRRFCPAGCRQCRHMRRIFRDGIAALGEESSLAPNGGASIPWMIHSMAGMRSARAE
jgi:hypothetical protein